LTLRHLAGDDRKETTLKRTWGICAVLLLVVAAAYGPARSSRVLASSHTGSHAAATKCKKGYKLVKGKCKKVKKATPTATPQPTSTPCTSLSCATASKFWRWAVSVVINGPHGQTTYTIQGHGCGQPQSIPWTVQYTYSFDNQGDVSSQSYYDDGSTSLSLPFNTFVPFPLTVDSEFPNPQNLRIDLRYDNHGSPGATVPDEITPSVAVDPPYKVRGKAAPGALVPLSNCLPG
jgi:hypothetical protein